MPTSYLSPKQVEEQFGITRAHLAVLRLKGEGGPKWYQPTPRKVLYTAADVTAWIEASAHVGTQPEET
ncbi:helix-turn-helix transcriptional regulator [Agromyces bauzanensis]